MSRSWPNRYASWPKYLPYPTSIPRSTRPVPNASSVNWPQSQFAPAYLPAGSPSFQPYSYLKQDVPLRRLEPAYSANNQTVLTRGGPYPARADVSRSVAALPAYGDVMFNPSTSVSAFRRCSEAELRVLPVGSRRKVRSLERRIQRLQAKRRLSPQERASLLSLASQHAQIRRLCASRARAQAVPVAATASAYGDGFAYELAPLQATPVDLRDYGLGAVDAGCTCSHKPSSLGSMWESAGLVKEGNLTTGGFVALAAACVAGYYVVAHRMF
jgi:hypothetical protein